MLRRATALTIGKDNFKSAKKIFIFHVKVNNFVALLKLNNCS